MRKRKLRFVRAHPSRFLGICERCNSQFKSSKPTQDDAEAEILDLFNAHKCELVGSSQNAVQISREAPED
jgi:hypothetical protein